MAHGLAILWPSRSLRDHFNELAQFTQQLGVLTTANQHLRAARDLLLPRLMSGEIAV